MCVCAKVFPVHVQCVLNGCKCVKNVFFIVCVMHALSVCVCVWCVCVCECVRACVRACVCVRAKVFPVHVQCVLN